jgi:hypothetical protein
LRPTPITLKANELNKALESEAFYSSMITLSVDGKDETVILKDLQRHPAKNLIWHADFQRVSKSSSPPPIKHKVLRAIEDIINDAVIHEEGVPAVALDLESLDYTDSIKDKIHTEFTTILDLLDFNLTAFCFFYFSYLFNI